MITEDTPLALPQRVYRQFVGIDIAANTATAAWLDLDRTPTCSTKPATITIEQSPGGFASLQKHLAAIEVAPAETLVVLEATNTCWIRLATVLTEAGYAVSVVNPKQAHEFGKAMLKQAKTDAIDAQMLAQLAVRLQPPIWTPVLATCRIRAHATLR